MPMCYENCDSGPCGSDMPQGEPTSGDPCMHVDCAFPEMYPDCCDPMGDQEEGPPEW